MSRRIDIHCKHNAQVGTISVLISHEGADFASLRKLIERHVIELADRQPDVVLVQKHTITKPDDEDDRPIVGTVFNQPN